MLCAGRGRRTQTTFHKRLDLNTDVSIIWPQVQCTKSSDMKCSFGILSSIQCCIRWPFLPFCACVKRLHDQKRVSTMRLAVSYNVVDLSDDLWMKADRLFRDQDVVLYTTSNKLRESCEISRRRLTTHTQYMADQKLQAHFSNIAVSIFKSIKSTMPW